MFNVLRSIVFERARENMILIANPDPNYSTAPAWRERQLLFFRDSQGSFEILDTAGTFSAKKE
jgi:hypothetical protein